MLYLDGGIGSEMDKRVLIDSRQINDDPSWCGTYHMHHSQILKKLYEEYIAAGSNIISANTYSCLQYLFKNCSKSDMFNIIDNAVDIANEIKEKHPGVLIAGCISAHGCDDVSLEDIESSLNLLQTRLIHKKVDMILVEMVQSVKVGKLMTKSVLNSPVPVYLGFSIIRGQNGNLLLKKDQSPFDCNIISEILETNSFVHAIGIMHSDVSLIYEAFTILQNVWKGPLMLYPDAGIFKNNKWVNKSEESKEYEIVNEVVSICKSFPQVIMIGGCCGLGPSYIHKLTSVS